MWGSCQGRCFFASSLIFIIGRSRSPCQICTKTDEKGCLHALERQLYQLVRSQGRRQQHTERECLSVATKHNNKPVFFGGKSVDLNLAGFWLRTHTLVGFPKLVCVMMC